MHYIDIERRKTKPREIGLVPMINIIFLMLIFFILAGKIDDVMVLPVDIPLSEQTSEQSLGEAVITLDQYDTILLGDDIIAGSTDELTAWVADRVRRNPTARFTLKADANMQATSLIDVMRAIERAGAQDVVLAAQRP